jgi:serine protease Do
LGKSIVPLYRLVHLYQTVSTYLIPLTPEEVAKYEFTAPLASFAIPKLSSDDDSKHSDVSASTIHPKPALMTLVKVKPMHSITSGLDRIKPSVFFIKRPVDTENYVTGSGVVYNTEGISVTNAHVVADAESVEVTFAWGEKRQARILAVDPDRDIAILDVGDHMPVPQWGDSEMVPVGSEIFVVGYPLGLSGDPTATKGIISRIVETPMGDLWQTDAAINPGNSGGPLCNISGEVLGLICSKIKDYDGLGFAIPAEMVREEVNQFLASKDGAVSGNGHEK